MLPRHPSHRANAGFTLVEMSIVLVLVGLLVGGILVGRDLIRSAELRSVLSDVDKFKSAANTFRLKYNGLPGDMRDATAYWGTDPGGCPNTPGNTVPKTATCNGNGDGRISDYNQSIAYYCEEYRFWQQLADAELIPGIYNGAVAGAMPNCAFGGTWAVGINVPGGKIAGSMFITVYYGSQDITLWSSPILPATVGKNFIDLLGFIGYGFPIGHVISPQEAYNIDSKVDDGLPASGSVLAAELMYGAFQFVDANDGDCVTSVSSLPTNYVSTSTKIKCSLAFAAGF